MGCHTPLLRSPSDTRPRVTVHPSVPLRMTVCSCFRFLQGGAEDKDASSRSWGRGQHRPRPRPLEGQAALPFSRRSAGLLCARSLSPPQTLAPLPARGAATSAVPTRHPAAKPRLTGGGGVPRLLSAGLGLGEWPSLPASPAGQTPRRRPISWVPGGFATAQTAEAESSTGSLGQPCCEHTASSG